MFAPETYGQALARVNGLSDAMSPWDAGTRYLNFEESVVDALLFYDDDDGRRALRALRTHWDPNGLFLANHEIK